MDIARFYEQRPGKEAVTGANRAVDTALVSAALPAQRRLESGLGIREHRIDRQVGPATLWTWYAVGNSPASTGLRAKVMELGNAVILRDSETAILTLVAWTDDAEAARDVLGNVADQTWQWYRRRGNQ